MYYNLVSQALPFSTKPMEPFTSNSMQFTISNQEKGPVAPMSYVPGLDSAAGSDMHLLPTQRVGEVVLGAQKQLLPVKRRAEVDSLPFDSTNTRMAHFEPPLSSPKLPQVTSMNKKSVQVQSTPGSNKKLARNESISSKSGSQRAQTPKNRTVQSQPSPKVQNESNEAVRSKMRETIAAALSVVCQHQNKDSTEQKGNQSKAADIPMQGVVSKTDQSTAEGPAVNDHLVISEQKVESSGQDSQFNYILPDVDGSFSDSFFVKDELLQGNGLSWAWELDVAETKEVQPSEETKSVNMDVGRNGSEQLVSSPEELASKIEAELFKLFGGVNKKYKEKGRSLMFNLKDRNNPELREKVISGEISPERLCSMTPEELASKELAEWRTAKAEELAQMKVLPDTDVRRLVKKTHKGEYQVEVEQDDGTSVEVSAGSSSFTQFRPKRKKEAPTSSEADEVKEEGGMNHPGNADLSCSLTIPADGTDLMQGLIVDEFKDAESLPPIVSLDEFMQSLDSEPPFEIIPANAEQTKSLSGKENPESLTKSMASDPAPLNNVEIAANTNDQTEGKPTELKMNVTTDESSAKQLISPEKKLSPVERKYSPFSGGVSPAERKYSPVERKISPADRHSPTPGKDSMEELLWQGDLLLSITSSVTAIGLFRSGEKTMTKDWPSALEIKGRVRLDAFEKFLQELPMSRSRAVMVLHFLLKEDSSEIDRASLSEAVDSYIVDDRLGFGEPNPGVEIYFCPPSQRILELLSKYLTKEQADIISSAPKGLIGVVVWRRPHISSGISPNSLSHHHKHKHNNLSRRHEDKYPYTNMNLTARPLNRHVQAVQNNDDDDDDIPPGFGPGAARDDDDLPEFNFSGGLNSSGQRVLAHGTRMTQAHPSRPVDHMRELIHKYGQTGSSTGQNKWNNDDDDGLPEWQPQLPQQTPRPAVHHVQLPVHPNMPPPPPMGLPQAMQWVAPQVVRPNAPPPPHYGMQWRQDAPRSRGF